MKKFTKSLTIPVDSRNYCFTHGFSEFPKKFQGFREIPKFVMLRFHELTKLVHMLSRSVLKTTQDTGSYVILWS